MNSQPVVFVVDDDPVYRTVLSGLLKVVGLQVETFGSAEEFLETYQIPCGKGLSGSESACHIVATDFDGARQMSPFPCAGCLLLDIEMPGMNGLELQQYLTKQQLYLPIVFVTGCGSIPIAIAAIQSGAIDFLEKPVRNRDHLLAAIRKALARDAQFRNDFAGRAEMRERLAKLTVRQRQVVDLLVAGKNLKAIAASLGTSHHTVRNQRARILKKMQADSVVKLVEMISFAE